MVSVEGGNGEGNIFKCSHFYYNVLSKCSVRQVFIFLKFLGNLFIIPVSLILLWLLPFSEATSACKQGASPQ